MGADSVQYRTKFWFLYDLRDLELNVSIYTYWVLSGKNDPNISNYFLLMP